MTVWSPALSMWQSHAMTIAVVSIMTPCVAFFVYRKRAAPSAQRQSESIERTSAQTVLLEAKEIAEPANRTKNERLFPDYMSQDIRAPMDEWFTNSGAPVIDEQSQHDDEFHPVFDADAALDRVEGDPELLRKMVGVFAKQWGAMLAEIAKAGQRRDGATLALAAHRLNGSLGSFGAAQASRVAQKLEAHGNKVDFHEVETTCVRLKMEVERLVDALKEYAKEMVSGTS
jgi:HPt (histidine-containing phosphotransfer) domain-containing protein